MLRLFEIFESKILINFSFQLQIITIQEIDFDVQTDVLGKERINLKASTEKIVALCKPYVELQLANLPILASPDFSKPFTIQTNVSNVGVSAILMQEHDDGERVIAYFSKKLASAQ